MRTLWVVGSLVLLVGLAACTEQPQVSQARTSTVPASAGTGGGPFVAEGWKSGDQTSWEEQMRTRTQLGQNEYPRASGN